MSKIEEISLKNVTKEMFKISNVLGKNMPINEYVNNKIVIFGAGKAGEEFIRFFPYKCEYIIDNDAAKWGTTMNDLPIYDIEKLKYEEKSKLFVMVTSMYYDEISKQLEENGLEEGVNFTNGSRLLIEISKNYYVNLHKDASVIEKITWEDLNNIQAELNGLGIQVNNYYIDLDNYNEFKTKFAELQHVYSSHRDAVQEEKMLEHFISYSVTEMENYSTDDIYVDVASSSSIWAKLLREKDGIRSYAIDLKVPEHLKKYNYYIEENATKSSFENNSICSMSLQCAFEMFMYDDDKNLILEASRILKKGGKLLISPLYLNTHYCSSSSPEYYSRGFSDPESKEYLRLDSWGIPSSRHYNSQKLLSRILTTIDQSGMSYTIYRIKNLNDINSKLYLNFFLEIIKH